MNRCLAVLCVLAIIIAVSATDYCSKYLCRNGAKHIACEHNGKFDASCPLDAEMINITEDLKQWFVHLHNVKRNFIAGGGDAKHSPACKMATIEWDDELSAIAALNAKQCKMAHDKCRNTDAFKYAGQNIAWICFYGATNNAALLNQTVEMWYSEVKNSHQSYIDSFPNHYSGPAIEHFTVMMAERNIRLGCAVSIYTLLGQSYKTYLAVCNYATINMINFPIYVSCSQAATSCTTGINPKYPNLCSAAEIYSVNKWF